MMTTSSVTRRQKVGLAIAGLISLSSVPSALTPTPEGETGPPYAILVLGSLLGVVGLVATVMAWRGNRAAMRVAAGALVINALTAVPAFFVDVPVWLKLLVAISVLVTVTALVLMFSGPARRAVPVMD